MRVDGCVLQLQGWLVPWCPSASRSGLLYLWLEPPVSRSKACSSAAGHALPWMAGVPAIALSEIWQPWIWSRLLTPSGLVVSSSVAAADKCRKLERTGMLDQKDTDLG